MSTTEWSGTPAEWDAERERKIKRVRAIINANFVEPVSEGNLLAIVEATMPPRPVKRPFTCVECGVADNSVFNVGGDGRRYSHASAGICREALKRELCALRDGPAPRYEVCGWGVDNDIDGDSAAWEVSKKKTLDHCEERSKEWIRLYGGTAHAIYRRVEGDK